jgi:type I restriction enzyme S subunit
MKVKLPKSWESAPLGDVCKTLKGKKPKNSGKITKDRTIPYINIKAFETGIPAEYTEPGDYPECSKKDVLIVWDGARSGLTGRGVAGYIGSTLSKIWSDIVDSGYLYYFLQSQYDYINTNTKGVGIPHVDPNILYSIDFPVAPENEQNLIVAEIEKQFSRLDEAVDNLKRVKANLKRYKASVLKSAVEGKLTEDWRKANPDVEPAGKLLERILAERRKKWEEAELAKMKAKGKISKGNKWKKKYKEPIEPGLNEYPYLPEGWCWATIEQLASDQPRSIQSGPFGSNLLHSEFQTEGKLVVGIDNVQDGYFSMGSQNRISGAKFKELEKYAARPGDVLITVMATIGRTCVIPDNIEPAIITKHIYRITPNTEIVMSNFLHLAIWGGAFVREQIFGQVIGQTRPGLNGTIIKRLAIPVPTLKEQAQILKVIQESLSILDKLIPEVDKAEMRSERLRQSILKKAFSGKLVSSDPSDEPASILLETIQKGHKDLPQRRKPSKTTRRRKMMKVNIGSIRKVIEQFPKDIFTFDELRAKVSTDYDTLKEILFTLLEGENPPLKQIFDEATLQIKFIRVKK